MEGLHNIIENVFQVVLVDALVISTHVFPQFEPRLPLKIDAFIKSQVVILVISKTVFILPSPKIVRGYPFQFAKVPLVSRKLLRQLLSFCHNCPVLFKHSSSKYALRVGYTLIYLYRGYDLKVLKRSDIHYAHFSDYYGSLMIKRIDVGEIPLNEVFYIP